MKEFTRNDLLDMSDERIRSNKTLFALFYVFFEEDLGYKPNCLHCGFSNNIKKWRNEHNKTL